MLYPQSETGPLWLVPWDAIYTPFTRAEMIDLALVDERADRTRPQIRAEATWVHPDDPLNRVQHFNFWDVLQESLSRRLLVSRERNILDDGLVAEFIDAIQV